MICTALPANGLYYKSLLDKLKVSTHVFRVGTYKSAVEPFIRDDMSPAAREADSRWIGELWQNYLAILLPLTGRSLLSRYSLARKGWAGGV